MPEKKEKEKKKIDLFLDYLEKNKSDRGMMADLRQGVNERTQYRAWPYIAPWYNLEDQRHRSIVLTIAAAFALHRKTASRGNMGDVLREIACGASRGNEGLKSFESRFRRLLSAKGSDEVCLLLAGILRTTERLGIPVNLSQLYNDLYYWGENSKVRWAVSFWKGAEPEGDAQ